MYVFHITFNKQVMWSVQLYKVLPDRFENPSFKNWPILMELCPAFTRPTSVGVIRKYTFKLLYKYCVTGAKHFT